jgi:hypothetical protein
VANRDSFKISNLEGQTFWRVKKNPLVPRPQHPLRGLSKGRRRGTGPSDDAVTILEVTSPDCGRRSEERRAADPRTAVPP